MWAGLGGGPPTITVHKHILFAKSLNRGNRSTEDCQTDYI